MQKPPARFTSLWRPKKGELGAPVLESKPLSSWKPAIKPPPRSSWPLKPKREELLNRPVLDTLPSFWCSNVVLTRPYRVTLLCAKAADVPTRASAARAQRLIVFISKVSLNQILFDDK